MATSFTFEDDKGMCSKRAPMSMQRMQRTGHNAKSLQERLRTLKKAWGNDIRRFPPSFYAQVRRPRGRPPAVTRQLRLGAATPKRQRTDTGDPAPLRSSGVFQNIRDVLLQKSRHDHQVHSSKKKLHGRPPQHRKWLQFLLRHRRQQVTYNLQVRHHRHSQQILSLVKIRQNNTGSTGTLEDPEEERSPPMSPSRCEQTVATIFADVPREVVVQGTNKNPHRNAGELMPCGISSLIRELGELGNSDIFLDIGAGVGNVVVQVALGTSVNKAIGIE
ncbi:Hypothetical protein PHPALM_2820, partial [Phytophthora palmivora]